MTIMMKKTLLVVTISAFAIAMGGCSASITTGGNTSTNAAKPANTAPATNSASNSANTSSKKTDSPAKTEMKNEEKPKVETKKQKNAPTIPAEWIYYADEVRGYGFSLPAGSKDGNQNSGGVDAFFAQTPDNISVIVYAFKDGTLTKEDLLERAEKAMASMGETITAGKLTNESDDYAICDADSVTSDGTKSKMKVLVATDVTDNYVMFVISDAASYDSKKATMDAIWGSFEMYSGGASNN